jgi:hypothetical protein
MTDRKRTHLSISDNEAVNVSFILFASSQTCDANCHQTLGNKSCEPEVIQS